MAEFPPLVLNSDWVERTLATLTLDQKIGQLLHPCLYPAATEAERAEVLGGIAVGGIFLFPGKEQDFQNTTRCLQKQATIPIIVSADLENGPGRAIVDTTIFPSMMALGATNNQDFAFEMGRAAALAGRACGVHWAFGPVVDINANPHNPITSTTSLGDNPDLITRLGQAMIRGMQQHGMCASAKHFPGGGFDDRDQHLCNTINPLRMDQWLALSGRMFQAAIDQGVWSIMIGHISLPAWDAGQGDHIQTAPPATLSSKILTALLREKMGFEGLIISDAMDMAGVAAWGPLDEIMPAAIEAGCDMILFAQAKRDFNILKRALETGRLSESRVEESVRRILALKERLALPQDLTPPSITLADRQHFEQTSQAVAEASITVVKDRNQVLPLTLTEGTRVLSYHLRGDATEANVDVFDDLLQARAVTLTRFDETDWGKLPKADELAAFDVILIHGVVGPSWGSNRIRLVGRYMRDVWSVITSHHPGLVFVSYGSPYLDYDFPHLPLVINAYSAAVQTQQAVLRVLTGQITATGQSPVNLNSPYLFKSQAGLRYLL